jgi:hypothetical protein
MTPGRSFLSALVIGIVSSVVAALLVKRDSSDGGSGDGGCSVDALRARVVKRARAEEGQARTNIYYADAAPQYVNEHPNWCGIFALWCLRQEHLTDKVWKTGYGFLLTSPPLPQVSDPKPGDIAYFTKYQHQAVVLANNGDGTVTLANGNGIGGVVSIGTRPISDAAAYYSIQKLCEAAVAKGCA